MPRFDLSPRPSTELVLRAADRVRDLRVRSLLVKLLTLWAGLSIGLPVAFAQTLDPTTTRPAEGIRRSRPNMTALTGGKVVIGPGQTLEPATVLISGQTIVAIGQRLAVPPGAEVLELSGKTIYPGLIDAAAGTAGLPEGPSAANDRAAGGLTRHWNRFVTPDNAPVVPPADRNGNDLLADATELRQQGITLRLVSPRSGIFGGWGHAVLVGGPPSQTPLLRSRVAQTLRLTIPQGDNSSEFPRSPMGAVALVRQTLLDADWQHRATLAHQADVRVPAPELDGALQTLAAAMREERFIIDCPNERFVGRAEAVAREFSLSTILRGSGREYQLLDSVASAGRTLLLPVAFPKPPEVETSEDAADVTLTELMHWYFAPENPARLAEAGVRFALTTDGLKKPTEFLDGVRAAVRRGLDREVALAAMTTIPAELLGVEGRVGSLATGKLANLLITDGDLFEHSTQVLETWVAGRRYRLKPEVGTPRTDGFASGRWAVNLDPAVGGINQLELSLQLDGRTAAAPGSWKGELKLAAPAGPPVVNPQPATSAKPADGTATAVAESTTGGAVAEQPAEEAKRSSVKLTDLLVQRDRLTATFDAEALDPRLSAGFARLSILLAAPPTNDAPSPTPDPAPADGTVTTPAVIDRAAEYWIGEIVWADGSSSRPRFTAFTPTPPPAEPTESKPTTEPTETKPSEPTDTKPAEPKSPAPPTWIAVDCEPNRPLGAAGFDALPTSPTAVLFRGATVWTCGPAGILETSDVLVVDGKIAAVGRELPAPEGCQIIEAAGLHISPGIIDCHSHIATDGGVNEASRAVTADVRIGDFIDHTDITIYRQLAGGVTTANVLHGSANPIGGQNQVIKLRWGSDPDGLRFAAAPPGIKFALGENVKRNTWRDEADSRYPQSRMGVEQLLRDRFIAAREYDASWRAWQAGQRSGLPPRRDLRLEALAEVLRGQRWVHCHSYRQDEIAALLRVLTEFNVQVGTLQHILEGYKVAEVLAESQAMASTFADWWAYKFEVFDAIPFNAAVMAQRGIVVSMNSDDRELGRHLNIEAAKAMRYGGVDAQEALKMVTLNPAKQLRIEHLVGSIEPGKDADLVLWSGKPLSITSRCEQTWVDGKPFFSRQRDLELTNRQGGLRTELIQAVLATKKNKPRPSGKDPAAGETSPDRQGLPEIPLLAEELRWPREDIYCSARRGHLQSPLRSPQPALETSTTPVNRAASAGAQP